MIRTGTYKLYGQLEELAEGNVDIDAFVYRNGTVVPADQVDDTSDPGIHTAPEKNLCNLSEERRRACPKASGAFGHVPVRVVWNTGIKRKTGRCINLRETVTFSL